jgi:phage tail-like protein
MADQTYQTVNFHFAVNFTLQGAKSVDVKFQSVTGLDATIDTETVKEGGENRFEHVIPTRRKYGPLILKRGLLAPGTSGLTDWLKKAFDDQIYETLETVVISLLDEQHQSLMLLLTKNLATAMLLALKLATVVPVAVLKRQAGIRRSSGVGPTPINGIEPLVRPNIKDFS